MSNALDWFEIPVTDLARARRFYGALLQAELQEESFNGQRMPVGLSQAASNALRKIEAVLPADLADPGETLFAPHLHPYPVPLVGLLRRAAADRRKSRFSYIRPDGAASIRTVRPLGLFYWGAAWTLLAWCELRNDFRNFRLDRISDPEVSEESFTPEPGKTLEDFLKKIGAGSP
jgi:predicted DNA-binding transcriptional regulator YafY